MPLLPIISVKNLVKSYGDFKAVKGISFEVFEGEIFGLLGPNGAGKSTTLEIIETLREKTSGEVWVNGFNIEESPEAIKKIIGVQLQTAGFYPNLNLTELMQLFVGLYQTPVDPMTLLKKVNLEDKAKAKYKELSGGQKQRFSIATTLINQPKIIFLDEPTTGLDPQARRNLWDLIKEISDNTRPLTHLGFKRNRIAYFQAFHIDDVLTVVCDQRPAIFHANLGLASHLDKLRHDARTGHRNNFYGQWKNAQDIDQL